MKTHRSLMTAAEIQTAEGRVREIAEIVISTHAAERMTQKVVTVKEIENCLRYGLVIEAHDEAGELRLVVRHDYGRPKVGIVVVVGLLSGAIITTWKNAGSDNHKTLNMLAYDRVKLNIILGRS